MDIINRINKHIKRNLNETERTNVIKIINVLDKKYLAHADSVANIIIQRLGLTQTPTNPPKFAILNKDVNDMLMDEIKSRDANNATDSTISGDKAADISVAKISSKLDRNLLRPQFLNQYIVLDSNYINYDGPFAEMLTFPLSNNAESTNLNTIIMKYPLENIIRFEILPFQLPPYAVYDKQRNTYIWQRVPPNKTLNVLVKEIVENTRTTAAKNYNFIARATQETNPEINAVAVTPINPNAVFRFPLKYLTNITVRFDDMRNTMYLPNPRVEFISVVYGSPTRISINAAQPDFFMPVADHVYISDFKVQANTAAAKVLENIMNSPAGYSAVKNVGATHTLDLTLDTTAYLGDPDYDLAGPFYGMIASRRIVIPINIQQLRDEVIDDFINST